MYGWSRQDLVGQSTSVLVPSEFVEQSAELRRRCRRLEPVRNVESVRHDRSGRVFPILLTLSLLTDENGQPLGIAAISKDIEKQKDAERQACEAIARRDEFLAMLSHELRNPLGAVLNAAELLERTDGSGEQVRSASKIVLRQARQMARLLDDLLDVSRITQGKIEIRKEAVELTSLIEEVLQAVKPVVDARAHELILETGSEPLWVEGDASRLLQIQENLLINAAKYTPPGGRICLSIQRDGDEAVIAVEDNGQGIPPDMLNLIFELFVQGPKSLARQEGGMGIGLSLVRLLVELHGGKVTVHSAGKDKGSRFTVRLPLTKRRPVQSISIPARELPGLRILLVEDNDDSRTMLEQLLRLDGCQISTASNGIEGYQAIVRESPDVVLLDIGLPEMDGYEVARRVRSELLDRQIQLIALTGYGRVEDHAAIMAAGFDEHLIKPIHPGVLAEVLRQCAMQKIKQS